MTEDEESARALISRFAKPSRGRPPKDLAETIDMRIIRGYFPFDGSKKYKPGQVVTVTKAEAKVMIAIGAAERANPLEM